MELIIQFVLQLDVLNEQSQKKDKGAYSYQNIELWKENPALELYNPDNLGERENTGKKKYIFKLHMLKNGLQARKQQRPTNSFGYCIW